MTVVRIPYRPRHPALHRLMESHRFVTVVAHRRFGKTVCAVNHLIKGAACCTARAGRFGYIAPFLNQGKMIAWDYLRYYTGRIPGIKVNVSELSVTLPTGAVIRIFGADNPDALRGGYFDVVVLDEVAQMKPPVWHEIVRPALADRQGAAVFIGTPKGQNLFKELFDRGMKGDDPEWASAMYRADETGVIDEKELASLRSEMSENAFRQEFLCDFSAESDDVLIPIDVVSDAARRCYGLSEVAYAPVVVGVDVARFGDDATVFFRRQGLAAFEPVVMKKLDNMAVADRLARYMAEFNPDAVFVDAGAGAGVIDRVRQLGYAVTEVAFGGRAISDKFRNRRAEMWVEMAGWLKSGGAIPDDALLKADLSAPVYVFDASGRMGLEGKEKIKERLGRSPDLADALALTFAAPVSGRAGGAAEQVEYNPLDMI